jgi:hypothetical protein
MLVNSADRNRRTKTPHLAGSAMGIHKEIADGNSLDDES